MSASRSTKLTKCGECILAPVKGHILHSTSLAPQLPIPSFPIAIPFHRSAPRRPFSFLLSPPPPSPLLLLLLLFLRVVHRLFLCNHQGSRTDCDWRIIMLSHCKRSWTEVLCDIILIPLHKRHIFPIAYCMLIFPQFSLHFAEIIRDMLGPNLIIKVGPITSLIV